MVLAPLILFVYNRPWHTEQTIKALQQNILASDTDLVIYSDAPKNKSAEKEVAEVRNYLQTINGFQSVTVIERRQNLGLSRSVIEGVTEVINKYGKIIVLEDDMVTSRYFLTYMNETLEYYEQEEKVISIHGYIYPVEKILPETFFIQGADCWGWATWQRGWRLFESNGETLLQGLKNKKLTKKFDLNGSYPFTKMLKDQIEGKNDSWAVRWYASAFLQNKLTLYPGRSLVRNIGNDNSGTHSENTVVFDTELSVLPVKINTIPLAESAYALQAIEEYLRSLQPSITRRLINKLLQF